MLQMYLYGVHFTLLTDHKRRSVGPQASAIQTSYTVYTGQAEHLIADSLSRLVEEEETRGCNDAEEFVRFVAVVSTPVAIPIRKTEEESAVDTEIPQPRECILVGEWEKDPPRYKAVRNTKFAFWAS